MFKTTFISFLVGFAFITCKSQSERVKVLDATAFAAAIAKEKKVQIIDVRTPQEFATGFIKGASNLDFYAPNFQDWLFQLDKNIPVYLYCKSSGRSLKAAELLTSQGYKQIYVLQGGMMGWVAANKEVMTASPRSASVTDAFTATMLDKEVNANMAVLVDYYADWCIPCKRMEPILTKLQKEYNGKVKILRINVEQAATLVKQKGIAGIPYLVTYKKGSQMEIINEEVGEARLRSLIKAILH